MVRKFCRGPVEEVSLASFAQERAIWVRSRTAPRFDPAEVTHRARSRLGEDRYRLLSNNCEHFSEWCLRDEHRSYQVERLLSLPRRLARIFGDTLGRLLPKDHARTDASGQRSIERRFQTKHLTFSLSRRLQAAQPSSMPSKAIGP